MKQSLELDPLIKNSHFFEKNIFSAYQVNAWKPDPTLFLTAAKSNGFSPSETLVIEDSPAGVQAAIAANMKVLGFAKGNKAEILVSKGATIISEMKDVFNYL